MLGHMSETPDSVDNWSVLLNGLASRIDLEASARQHGLLQRVRAIKSASDLLRLIVAYSLCGLSLKQTAFWAEAQDVAIISAPGLFKQFRRAADWIESLLACALAENVPQPPLPGHSSAVRLVDATHVSRRGAKKLDLRLHVCLDLASLQFRRVELTPAKQGESLCRVPVASTDLVIGDAGYAKRPGLWHVVEAGGSFIVRHHWHNVPLQRPDGDDFDLFAALATVPDQGSAEFPVAIADHPEEPAKLAQARLIALRKDPEAAEKAKRRLLAEAKRKGRSIDLRSLIAAEYVMLLTSAEQALLSADMVLTVYRYRWQIELAFKRLKSLVNLDDLPIKDLELSRTVLAARLLMAILMDRLTRRVQSFSPSASGKLDPAGIPLDPPGTAVTHDPHGRPRGVGRHRLVGSAVSQSTSTR